jgi:hypothetical protein
MLSRPDHADWRPKVWIWIAILALWMSVSGRLQQSSHICVLERNPEAWSNTESRPNGLLNCMDGCRLEQFEASRHKERSGRESTSSGWMMLLSDVRLDGMIHCPDGWFYGQLGVRTVWHVVRAAGKEQNFLICKLCRIFWKHFRTVESLLKSIITMKWFCPTECGQLETNTLNHI